MLNIPSRWTGTKITSESSRAWATLHFLLDHPRRCFLYLFPSHQTWYEIQESAFSHLTALQVLIDSRLPAQVSDHFNSNFKSSLIEFQYD
jgi:hypothetical protein